MDQATRSDSLLKPGLGVVEVAVHENLYGLYELK
jgi:hypothetical protein